MEESDLDLFGQRYRTTLGTTSWVLIYTGEHNNMKIKNNKEEHSQLAISVYVLAMKKQIEEEIKSKYLKRIDYLVGANNELAHELKKCEEEHGIYRKQSII